MMEYRNSACQNSYRPPQNNHVNTAVVKKPCRKELLDKINQYSFAVNEATLFLDTHPCDKEAMNYFQKYRVLRIEALEEYGKYYAPLLIDYAVSDQSPWSWANEPWPWEGVEC